MVAPRARKSREGDKRNSKVRQDLETRNTTQHALETQLQETMRQHEMEKKVCGLLFVCVCVYVVVVGGGWVGGV